jgi:hypothetical protein
MIMPKSPKPTLNNATSQMTSSAMPSPANAAALKMAGVPLIVPLIAPPARHRSLLPILALLALNGAVGLAAWQSMGLPIDITAIKPTVAAAPADRPAAADPGSLVPRRRPAAELPETARRPLFAANRRPWVEKSKPQPVEAPVKVAAPPAPAYPANQLQLVGILQGTRNNAARALIRAGGDSQGSWIKVGESIKGWKLREVTSGDVAVIETGGQRAELGLERSTR